MKFKVSVLGIRWWGEIDEFGNFMFDLVNFFVYKWSILYRKKNIFIDKEFNIVFEVFLLEREINVWCGLSGYFVLEYVFF